MRSMMPKDSSSTRQAVGVVLLSLFIPVVGVALFSRLWKPTSPSSLSSSEYSLDYFTPTPTPLFLLLSCVLILALLTLLNTNPGTISPPNSLSSQDPDSLSYPTHNNSQEEEEEEQQQQQGEEGREEELEQDQAELLLVEKIIYSENSFESSSTTKDQSEEEELELVNSREAIATYRESSIDSSIGSSIESSIESSVKEDQEEVVHMERVLVDSENSFESIKEEPEEEEEEDKITKIVASVDGQINRIESSAQEEREIDYRFKEVKESKEAAGKLVAVDLVPRERPYQHHRSLSADIIKVDPLREFGGGGHHLQYSIAALNSSNKNNPQPLARPPSRFGLHGHGAAAAAHHGHRHHHQVHRHRAVLGVAPRSMKGSVLLSSSATSGSSTSGPNLSGAPNSSLVGSSSSSVSVSTEAANKSMEAIWKEIMQSSSRSPAAASISFRHARNLHSKLAKKSSATSSTLSRHTSSLSTASSSSSTTSQNLIDKNDNCATSSSSQTPTPTAQTNTQPHVAITPSPCKPKPRRKVPMSSRREISMTNEELNRRVESFITEFRHQIHIQREQSLLKTQNIKP